MSPLKCIFTVCITISMLTSGVIAIVKGSMAQAGEFPYFISLRTSSNVHWCGGAIISPSHILTAGHCVQWPKEQMVVVAGTNKISIDDGIRRGVKEVSCYPGYSKYDHTSSKDIAILTLNAPFKSSEPGWSVIKLARRDYQPGWKVTFPGLGDATAKEIMANNKDMSEYLKKGEGKLLSMLSCRNMKPSTPSEEHNLCVRNSNFEPRQGDSGGPLVVNGEIIGVASITTQTVTAFTKVYRYLDFIKQKSHVTSQLSNESPEPPGKSKSSSQNENNKNEYVDNPKPIQNKDNRQKGIVGSTLRKSQQKLVPNEVQNKIKKTVAATQALKPSSKSKFVQYTWPLQEVGIVG